MLVAEVAIFFEGAVDDFFEARRQVGIEADRGNRRAIQDGFEDEAAGVTAEGERAGGHFIEDDTEREEIAAGVHLFAPDLLGRHVGDGAQSGAGTGEVLGAGALRGGGVDERFTTGGDASGNLGKTEVENFGGAAFGDEDIRGFYIAMDNMAAWRAASRASAMSMPISRRRKSSSGLAVMTCLRVAPSRNSMAMKARPFSSPMS